MKIAVIGAGYVGLSVAVMLSNKNSVMCIDINKGKVGAINNRISPIKDKGIEKYFKYCELDLKASYIYSDIEGSELVIMALPTDFDESMGTFNTDILERCIKNAIDIVGNYTPIVIKSTVPVGFTERVRKETGANILFSPEFLREGSALYDNLNPRRVVIGYDTEDATQMKAANSYYFDVINPSLEENTKVFFMRSNEAESVKLFSNTYLAMRVAFFNELDTYSRVNNMHSKSVIDAVCADERIGSFYNNPSFGYGGYCLPKDTKQLLSNYGNINQKLISAVVDSNNVRKEFIASDVIRELTSRNGSTIGIYRLVMKSGSDNFRSSSVIDVVRDLKRNGISMVIYEPLVREESFIGIPVVNDFRRFTGMCDVILANRLDAEIRNYGNKLYSRDLFSRD